MQIYVDIFRKGNKTRTYINNATDKLNISFTVDDISHKQLSTLVQAKFAKYSTYGIIVNATAQEIDGFISEDLAFNLGGYADQQERLNPITFTDFVYMIEDGSLNEEIVVNEKYYFNMDCKIEKIIIDKEIDSNTYILKSKDGLYSSSLLFDTELELKIKLCLDFNNLLSGGISKKEFYQFLDYIFTPHNIIMHREKLMPLLKLTYFSNKSQKPNFDKNNHMLDVPDYLILMMEVTYRFRNLVTNHNQSDRALDADLMYILNYTPQSIQSIYKPVNFNYIRVIKEIDLDIEKWYLNHNINVNSSDFF
jgi:hypothetical protein